MGLSRGSDPTGQSLSGNYGAPALRLKARLLAWVERRSKDHRSNLQYLITGAAVFFCCAGVIVLVNRTMENTLEQELIALAAMILGLVGIGIALYGYLGLSLLRLIGFLLPDDKPEDD